MNQSSQWLGKLFAFTFSASGISVAVHCTLSHETINVICAINSGLLIAKFIVNQIYSVSLSSTSELPFTSCCCASSCSHNPVVNTSTFGLLARFWACTCHKLQHYLQSRKSAHPVDGFKCAIYGPAMCFGTGNGWMFLEALLPDRMLLVCSQMVLIQTVLAWRQLTSLTISSFKS